jgi:N-acetyl-gamma-glutamyl-phosphate reductase
VIKAGIIGGAGYTAGELLRLLVNHPEVEISFIHSTSNAGNPVASVHTSLFGECDLVFSAEYDLEAIDVLFLCSAHGQSSTFLTENDIPEGLRIVDLAQDFRNESNGFVYGLPELNRERTHGAHRVANPGCFATCIELGLLPLAKEHLLKGDISVNAITGSTGAGVKPQTTTHFSWRNDNISIYKPFEHQHLPEILQSVKQLQPDYDGEIDFIPYRGGFARGIFATIVVKCDLDIETLYKLYESYYDRDSFTHIVNTPLDLKQVINTNKCLIHLEKHGNKLLITSIIDNLLKGASGQAVHNMNLLFGLAETVGLQLKPSAF